MVNDRKDLLAEREALETGRESVFNMEYGDTAAQIGEADTWQDKLRTLVRQNKLAAFPQY